VESNARTPERTRDLEDTGAVVADGAAEAAQLADVVITMVTDIDAVRAVAIDQGMLDAMGAGSMWVQMSTIGLAVDGLVDLVAQRRPDVTFIDAPVAGSRQQAETGTLTIFASGPARAQARVAPFFDAVGARTVWIGAAGSASRVKLVNNTLLAFDAEGIAGALTLTRRLGLPGDTLLAALDQSALLSPWARAKLRRILTNDYSTEFSLANARKDVGLAIGALGPDDAATLRALAESWDEVIARGLGEHDVTIVARAR
jgi:3-hydroxyisobutyrate dehydrogenase